MEHEIWMIYRSRKVDVAYMAWTGRESQVTCCAAVLKSGKRICEIEILGNILHIVSPCAKSRVVQSARNRM